MVGVLGCGGGLFVVGGLLFVSAFGLRRMRLRRVGRWVIRFIGCRGLLLLGGRRLPSVA